MAASRLKAGQKAGRGAVRADLQNANAGQFERLVAQGRGGQVLSVVDGEKNKVVAPSTPRGTTRLIHNHPRFNDVMRGGGFSSDDLAFATDRYRGNFHVMSDEGSVYAMKAGKNAPKTSYGVDKLAARHGKMVKAMADELKAGGVSPYEARISARSAAARVLKKEGVINYREVLAGTEKAAVQNNAEAVKSLITKHMQAPRAGGMAQSVMRASALATPVAAASVATLAFKRAQAEGKTEARAAIEAAGAGASAAVAPAAVGAAAAKLARASSIGAKALGVASRALLPLSVLGHAGAYALDAIRRGESASGVAKAAGWGAVNGVIPVDLAMEAYGAVGGGASPSASTEPGVRSVAQAQTPGGADHEFAAADAAFRQKWAKGQETAQAEKGAADPRKGWANPSTQHAAQSARGVQNYSDWAEPGEKE